MNKFKKLYECPLCGSINPIIHCYKCLGTIGNKPIKNLSIIGKYREIAIIDTVGHNRVDLRDHRRLLVASLTNNSNNL